MMALQLANGSLRVEQPFFWAKRFACDILVAALCNFGRDFQRVISDIVQEELGKFHLFAVCCANTSP